MKRFDIHEWQASQIKKRLVEQNIDSKNPDRDPWQDLYGKQNPNDPKAIPGKHFPVNKYNSLPIRDNVMDYASEILNQIEDYKNNVGPGEIPISYVETIAAVEALQDAIDNDEADMDTIAQRAMGEQSNLDKTKDSLDSFFKSGKSFKPNQDDEDLTLEPEDLDNPDEDLVDIGGGYLDIKSNFTGRPNMTNGQLAAIGQNVVDGKSDLQLTGEMPKFKNKEEAIDYIMNQINEAEVTGMEPDTGNMEKEYKVIGPKNQSEPLDDVSIEYNGQTYELDFEFGEVIDDHGNKGKDLWFEATADDGTYFMVDVYASNYDNTGDVDEIFWDTLEITPSEDPRMDPAIRSDFDDPVIDEQNSLGTAGSGASFTPGNGMGFMSPKIFKRKNKLN
jgi:hypothetical protein